VSCIDGFVVVTEGAIADFAEFVFVKIGAEILLSAIEPVLCVPVLGGAIDYFRWYWTVNDFFPQLVICDFVVNRGKCVVE